MESSRTCYSPRKERHLGTYVKVRTTASQVSDLLRAVYKFEEWKLQKLVRPSSRTSDAVETIGYPHGSLQLLNRMHARIYHTVHPPVILVDAQTIQQDHQLETQPYWKSKLEICQFFTATDHFVHQIWPVGIYGLISASARTIVRHWRLLLL